MLFAELPATIQFHGIRVGFSAFEMVCYCAERYDYFGMENEHMLSKAVLSGGQYHDIGKLLLSGDMLTKSVEDYSPVEKQMLRQHTLRSGEIISEFEDDFFVSEMHKKIMIDMGKYHHERVDGMGYPDGLSKYDIPLLAQLCAVANRYDRLVLNDVYTGNMTYDEAREEIMSKENTYFGSEAIRCFVLACDEISMLYKNKQGRLKESREKNKEIIGG